MVGGSPVVDGCLVLGVYLVAAGLLMVGCCPVVDGRLDLGGALLVARGWLLKVAICRN
jgi:hypothetical protein